MIIPCEYLKFKKGRPLRPKSILDVLSRYGEARVEYYGDENYYLVRSPELENPVIELRQARSWRGAHLHIKEVWVKNLYDPGQTKCYPSTLKGLKEVLSALLERYAIHA